MPEQPQETLKETPTAWTPELSMKVRDLGAVRVSPNGTQVVYTVTDFKNFLAKLPYRAVFREWA